MKKFENRIVLLSPEGNKYSLSDDYFLHEIEYLYIADEEAFRYFQEHYGWEGVDEGPGHYRFKTEMNDYEYYSYWESMEDVIRETTEIIKWMDHKVEQPDKMGLVKK